MRWFIDAPVLCVEEGEVVEKNWYLSFPPLSLPGFGALTKAISITLWTCLWCIKGVFIRFSFDTFMRVKRMFWFIENVVFTSEPHRILLVSWCYEAAFFLPRCYTVSTMGFKVVIMFILKLFFSCS